MAVFLQRVSGPESALDSHTHLITQAYNNIQVISALTFTEVLKVTLNIPDKCTSSSAPVDQWNVLVIASGYLNNHTSAYSGAYLALAMDNEIPDPTFAGTSIFALLPDGGTNLPFSIHWLYTDVGSGAHDFRLMAMKTSIPSADYTARSTRLTAQAMGYECAS